MRRRWDWAAAALIVAVFLGAASRQLRLPHLLFDECMEAQLALRLLSGAPQPALDWAVSLGGRVWPLRVPHPYDFSALNIYYSALAFTVGGPGVETLRWAALLPVAALLAIFYALCRRFLSPAASLAGLALLAAHPAVVIWGREAFWAAELILGAFAMASVALSAEWHRTRRPRALYAACFLLGFSANVSTKSLAFILALPSVYFAFFPAELRPSRREAAFAAAFGALGALNPLLFLVVRRRIVPFLARALLAPTRRGVDNAAVLSNAGERLRQLAGVLSGAVPAAQAGPVQARAWGSVLLSAGAVVALAAAARRARSRGDRRKAAALCALLSLLFAMTCFTPSGLDEQHLLVLLPFLAVAWAASFEAAARAAGARPMRRRLAVAACGTVWLTALGSQLRVDAAYFAQLRRTGGEGFWSSALYRLTDDLEARGALAPHALTPGLAPSLYVSSGGRVRPDELHSFQSGRVDGELRREFAQAAAEPGAVFLALGRREWRPEDGGARAVFEETLARAGRRLVLDKRYDDWDGRPVAYVYHAEPLRKSGRL